ncbi:hypothetical protein DM02DRAFT_651743 [Periconia macrospinosa]|uniref:Uncharacterized protein n=1 Tax=Periconia macrospinosa TaxID=97972 RepID=A0A2V1E4R7_9PLEO|nr:hypothetical protein DM02DRAFT_651743 [Periconia macrospinosa]
MASYPDLPWNAGGRHREDMQQTVESVCSSENEEEALNRSSNHDGVNFPHYPRYFDNSRYSVADTNHPNSSQYRANNTDRASSSHHADSTYRPSGSRSPINSPYRPRNSNYNGKSNNCRVYSNQHRVHNAYNANDKYRVNNDQHHINNSYASDRYRVNAKYDSDNQYPFNRHYDRLLNDFHDTVGRDRAERRHSRSTVFGVSTEYWIRVWSHDTK